MAPHIQPERVRSSGQQIVPLIPAAVGRMARLPDSFK
jgi:hypothetical protein